MSKKKLNSRGVIKGNKKMILVLPIYILFLIVFYVILGFGVGDIWDKLVKWAKNESNDR